jgi:hypothetical protein
MAENDNVERERVSKARDEASKALAAAKTDEDKIKVHYQFGQGSIQDIARVYRRSVDEVLHILELDDMSEVQTQGDLIDQSEAGPEVRVNPNGNPARAHYTTD